MVALVLAVPGGVVLAERGGWRTSFLCLALLAALAAALVGTAFPRLATLDAGVDRGPAQIMRRPMLQAHLALSALLFAAMFAGYSYLAAFLEKLAGFDGVRIAAALMGFGIAGVIGNWSRARSIAGPTAASAGVAFVLMLAMAGASLAGGEVCCSCRCWRFGAPRTPRRSFVPGARLLAAPTAPAFASSLNIAACNLGIAAGAEAGGWVVDQHGIGAAGYGGGALAALALALALAMARLGQR